MTGNSVIFTRGDIDLITALAGCSLDEKPGSNWVQDSGGLPTYICEIARAVRKTGKSTSQAVAIAVSRVKKWSAGVGVDKGTQAKAATALAEWERLKGKNKAATAGKDAGKVAASHTDDDDVLCLTDFNMDTVRQAFSARTRKMRGDWRKSNPSAPYDDPDSPPYFYVQEVWNTFLIVRGDDGDQDLYKIPYTVTDDGDITFADPIEVRTEYVEVKNDDIGDDVDDQMLKKVLQIQASASPAALDKILSLAGPGPSTSALERIVALTGHR